MAQISAVIITYNEEAFIGKCLDSLAGIADEILVVDSYSTDNTEAECASRGVRFEKHSFEGYVEQKNYALSLASNDLVLSLDADEAVSDEMRKSILTVKEKPQCDGYTFNRLNNYCGRWIRHSRWYPDRQLRLFDRRKGRWTGPNPHDKFRLAAGVASCHLPGDILHWNYASFEEHMAKMNRFSTISAESYFAEGRTAGPLTGIFHMTWSFTRSYLLRAGFLDGHIGFMGCAITAWGCFLKYSKLRMLTKEKRKR